MRELVDTSGYGLYAIILFTEGDDYYQYISHFYREGQNPASGGVFLSDGYQHIAAPYQDLGEARYMLVHELMHQCLSYLPIPRWLNEGLAVVVEKFVGGGRDFVLDRDLADRHRAFWSEAAIQDFWAGVAFQQPGEAVELSYSLAEILVHRLWEPRDEFLGFVRHADYSDAGQTAALDYLALDLGDVIAGFLGPGNWRPNRKSLANLWDRSTGN